MSTSEKADVPIDWKALMGSMEALHQAALLIQKNAERKEKK